MEAFRQFLKGWLGKLLLIIFLAPLVFLGIESYSSSSANTDILVTIGEQQITQQEFNRYYISAKQRQLQAVNNDASQIDEVKLKEQVLDDLINRTVILQHAKKLGLYPTDGQINSILLQDPEFQENGQFSQAKFETFLRNNGIDKRHVFANMSEQMAYREAVQLAASTGFMTKAEQDKLYELQSAERKVWVNRINSSDYTDKVSVTYKQITTYYNKHKNNLKTKRTVDLSYIKLNKSSLSVDKPNASDIDIAYQDYVSRLKTNGNSEKRKVSHILLTDEASKAKADAIIEEINAGLSFAEAAKKYSQDDSTKDAGGQLEYFGKQDESQDANFIAAIYQLKQVGDISGAVETQYGKHIIRLDEIKSNIPTKDSMLEELTENLTTQKMEDAYQDIIKKVNDSVVNGVALADIASEQQLPLLVAKNFEDAVINTGVLNGDAELNNAELKKQIFDEFNISDQIASVGVAVDDDTTIWVQSKNFRPVREKTLKEAKKEISAILLRKKAKELAKQAANSLVAEANSIDGGSKLVNDSAFEELGVINRQNQVLSQQESAGVFSIQLPNTRADNKIVAKAISTDSGYSVMLAQQVPKDEANETPEMIKMQMTAMMTQLAGQKSYLDYLQQVKSEAKIEKNDTLIKKVIEGKLEDSHQQ